MLLLPADVMPEVNLNVTLCKTLPEKSPYLEEAIKRCTDLCKEYNFTKFSKEFIEFCAYCYPFLPETEFYLVSAILMYTWLLDDVTDNPQVDSETRRSCISGVLTAMKSGKIDPHNNYAGLLMKLIKQIKNDCLREYFKQNYTMFLNGMMKLISNEGELLDFDEHLKLREADSGSFVAFMLMFLDKDDFEPYKVFIESEKGKRAWDLASKNTCYLNDIMSLKKDKKIGCQYNLVFTWMKEHKKTEEEAIIDLKGMACESMNLLLALRADDIGEEYLKRVTAWCRGHNVWTVKAPRYQ